MIVPPEISVVVPTFNEEGNVAEITSAITSELAALGVTWELIFIDNCSSDTTRDIVLDLSSRDSRIKLIVNQRNYGQMRSPTYGIYQASGLAVISLCADFQDPPALIPQFIASWRNGFKVVLGQRKSESAGVGSFFARKVGYLFAENFFDYPIIPDVTGFGLYDRSVVHSLSALNEPEPLFRGMLVELGVPIKLIPYSRPGRRFGFSKNNFLTLYDFSLSGLGSSGKRLLRLPVAVGLVSLCLSLLAFIWAGISWGAGRSAAWALILGLVQLNSGVLLLFVGLIGDQVRLNAERLRGTPLVREAERINFDRGNVQGS